MKRLDEYKDEELAVLSGEEVATIINVECAFKGVAALPPYPEDPAAYKPPYDKTMFCLFDFYFENEDDARMVLDAFMVASPRTQGGYHHKGDLRLGPLVRESYSTPSIERRLIYSPYKYKEVEPHIEEHRVAKDLFEKRLEVYVDVAAARQKMREAVCEVVNKAKDKAQKKQQIKSQYLAYLEMAEGETSIAIDLLKKIYSTLDGEFEKELRLIKLVDEKTLGRKLNI